MPPPVQRKTSFATRKKVLPTPTLLIATKLHRPSQRESWVVRPHLITRLNAGLDRQLTLISAPAGFGKTTLAGQWVANCAQPVAWLSLDPHDNDPIQFLQYFVAAVRTCIPDVCPHTHDLLTALRPPALEHLINSLVSELSAISSPFLIVLDDYHHIRSSEVHSILRRLLQYQPPALHLVILTRFDPPLHLGRLRIGQHITELRASDLRFGTEEVNDFLDHRLDHLKANEVSDEIIKTLHARTEGWIVGLELASISLQQQGASDFLARFHGSDRLLVGYLVEEVMVNLPEVLQEFLLRMSLMDRFCAPLADALVADDDPSSPSSALIARLEEMNLFIVSLDEGRYWYRFHDLFRDFLLFQLRQQQPQRELAQLHRRASGWFADAGLIEDALRHALAAGDEAAAAELVTTQFHSMIDQQLPGPTLLRWLALFPAATIQAQPSLLLAQVWLSAFGIGPAAPPTQLADLETRIQQEPSFSPARRQTLLTDLNLLRGILAYWNGDSQRAIEILHAAREQQSPKHAFARAQLLLHLAAAYTCTGQIAEGFTLLRTALAEEQARQRPSLLILLGGLAILHLRRGELAEVIHAAQQSIAAVEAAEDRGDWQDIGFVDIWHAWAHYLLGAAYYEQNELAAAAQHWQRVESMRYHTNPGVYHDSLLGLALIAQANGTPDQATTLAGAAREFAVEMRRPGLMVFSDSFEVRLALRNGEAKGLGRRTRGFKTTANQGMIIGLEVPPLTRLRAQLAETEPEGLLKALAFSKTCLHHAESTHNVYQLIQILVLQALILHRLRRTEEAFDVLAQALVLAEPDGFMRTFLDLGAPLAELLREFSIQRGASTYATRVLAAFPQELDPIPQRDLAAEYAQRYGITPLTPRELEVLELVGQRLTLAEIADNLVISLSTVKNHTHNIYSKLGVRSGRKAVARAREIGLLPPQ